MFTKMVLPMLGGTHATWTTAVVFFQAMLFAGYLYAHLTTRALTFRLQALLHIVLLVSAFAVLPVATVAGWTSPGDTSPVIWLIGLLTVSIGLPFFAVSATTPLLQSWLAQTGHKSAADPYFLYGASNLGSFVALLSYPFVIEPVLGLGEQGRIWAWGYAALAAFICVIVVVIRRSVLAGAPNSDSIQQTKLADQIDWKRRIHWLLLAFFPVSLLLGVTLHISTNIAASPFLWTLPLAIYLLSFVLVFARKPKLKHAWMLRLQVIVVIALVIQFWSGTLWLLFLLHLSGLFVMAMVCHGELAKRRPATRHLTEFYIWLSLGGLLGGIASVLVAPIVFDSVFEYPLALIIACALRPVLKHGGKSSVIADLTLPLGMVLLVLLLARLIHQPPCRRLFCM